MGCGGSTEADSVAAEESRARASGAEVVKKKGKSSNTSSPKQPPATLPADDSEVKLDAELEMETERKTHIFQSRKRGSEEIVAQTAKIARVPTAFAITFGNVCDDSDGTDAVVLSLDAGDMENCGVSRWVNRVSVGREVSGSPLGEVEASIPEGVVHTAIGGGSYHLKWSRGLQIPYDISCDNVPQMSLEVWVMPKSYPSEVGWLISQENKNDGKRFKRGLALADARFGGGMAVGCGASYTSTLPRPAVGHWHHIVCTFDNGRECFVYHHAPALGLEAKQAYVADNEPGLENFTIGGHELHANHHVDVLISQVNVFNRVLTEQEVSERYKLQKQKYLSSD